MTREQLRRWAAERAHPGFPDVIRASGLAVIALLHRVDELEAAIGEQRHVVDLRESDFGLQHPVDCRPDLLGCAVNRALNDLSVSPRPVGRYVVAIGDDGVLYFEELT